jgi:hypothetical protein
VTAALAAALDRLPRREREAVELCLVQELPLAAAAAALGVPVGTMKSRLARGREQLQRLLRSSDVSEPSPVIGHELQVCQPCLRDPDSGIPPQRRRRCAIRRREAPSWPGSVWPQPRRAEARREAA